MDRHESGRSVLGAGLIGSRAAWLAAAGLAFAAQGASGQVLLLRNDTLEFGQPGFIQLGFVDNEVGASVYTLDASLFPLRVTRVQIAWRSFFGTSANFIQDAIVVYRGQPPSTSLVAETDPIQLADGFLNDFDVTPYDIVIESAQANTITVGMRFLDAPAGDILEASLVTDGGACNFPLGNAVFSFGGLGSGWIYPCLFGMQGDFVIRVQIEKIVQTCYADCDQSTGQGSLDFFDFICFQDEFASMTAYACECDSSTGVGVCDFFDFICFQDAFAAGC